MNTDLNKTCFNGLFRVNSAGEFNTPFGHYKNPNIVNEPTLRAVSKYFNASNVTFYNEDFADTLERVGKGGFSVHKGRRQLSVLPHSAVNSRVQRSAV